MPKEIKLGNLNPESIIYLLPDEIAEELYKREGEVKEMQKLITRTWQEAAFNLAEQLPNPLSEAAIPLQTLLAEGFMGPKFMDTDHTIDWLGINWYRNYTASLIFKESSKLRREIGIYFKEPETGNIAATLVLENEDRTYSKYEIYAYRSNAYRFVNLHGHPSPLSRSDDPAQTSELSLAKLGFLVTAGYSKYSHLRS